MIEITIRGLQKAQAANARRIAALKPSGAVGHFIKDLTVAAHRFLLTIVHVDTGAYRASNRMTIDLSHSPRGLITPDTSAINPRSGMKVIKYAPIEEERGGSHAAYKRTFAYGKTLMPRLAKKHFRGRIR